MTENTYAATPVPATVFIVDDDPSICDGLCNLLESVGMKAEHFPSTEAFFEQWNSARSGCLVLDVNLPGMSGVEFQEKLLQTGRPIPIIFMTAYGDIPMVRKVMKSGAIEFLTKPFQKHELLDAVKQALAVDQTRREQEEVIGAILARFDSLTEREREVLAMVTTGMLNKHISAELNLSEITVKLHRRHVMDKMQANSLAELVKMCERAKLPSRSSIPRP